MATETTATLNVDVRGQTVATTAQGLGALSKMAANAQLATDRLTRSSAQTAAALSRQAAAASRATAAQNAAAISSARLTTAQANAARATMQLAAAQARVANSHRVAAGAANTHAGALRALATVAATIGVARLATGFISYADAMSGAEARIGLVTKGSEQLADVNKKLFDLANDNRSGLLETQALYARTARAASNLGTSQEDLLKVTDTVQKALIISGANAGEAASSMLQLSQAIGSGTFGNDEFRSLSENAPRLMQALADAIEVPIGKLKALSKEGKLTGELLIQAFVAQNAKVTEEFARMPVTVSQALTVLNNNLLLYVAQVNKGAGATKQLSATILDVAKKLQSPEYIAAGIKIVQVLVDGFSMLIDVAKVAADNIELVGIGLGLIVGAQVLSGLARMVGLLADVASALKLTGNLARKHPLLALAGLAAAVIGTKALADNWDSIAGSIEKAGNAFEKPKVFQDPSAAAAPPPPDPNGLMANSFGFMANDAGMKRLQSIDNIISGKESIWKANTTLDQLQEVDAKIADTRRQFADITKPFEAMPGFDANKVNDLTQRLAGFDQTVTDSGDLSTEAQKAVSELGGAFGAANTMATPLIPTLVELTRKLNELEKKKVDIQVRFNLETVGAASAALDAPTMLDSVPDFGFVSPGGRHANSGKIDTPPGKPDPKAAAALAQFQRQQKQLVEEIAGQKRLADAYGKTAGAVAQTELENERLQAIASIDMKMLPLRRKRIEDLTNALYAQKAAMVGLQEVQNARQGAARAGEDAQSSIDTVFYSKEQLQIEQQITAVRRSLEDAGVTNAAEQAESLRGQITYATRLQSVADDLKNAFEGVSDAIGNAADGLWDVAVNGGDVRQVFSQLLKDLSSTVWKNIALPGITRWLRGEQPGQNPTAPGGATAATNGAQGGGVLGWVGKQLGIDFGTGAAAAGAGAAPGGPASTASMAVQAQQVFINGQPIGGPIGAAPPVGTPGAGGITTSPLGQLGSLLGMGGGGGIPSRPDVAANQNAPAAGIAGTSGLPGLGTSLAASLAGTTEIANTFNAGLGQSLSGIVTGVQGTGGGFLQGFGGVLQQLISGIGGLGGGGGGAGGASSFLSAAMTFLPMLGLADGGQPTMGGDTIVGERGPERVRFPAGVPARVIPNNAPRRLMGPGQPPSGGGMRGGYVDNSTINIDGRGADDGIVTKMNDVANNVVDQKRKAFLNDAKAQQDDTQRRRPGYARNAR